MNHSCVGLEFLNEKELYVLTVHQDGEYYDSRIFSLNIDTHELQLMFIFEDWIKRFKIIQKEMVYASQWDDSIYKLSASLEDQKHVAVPCITDFKILPDGRLVIVGFDGRIVFLPPDGKTENVDSKIERDILYCLPDEGVIYGCGADGLYFEIKDGNRVQVTDLQTTCFLTSMCLAPDKNLLISGRGILMKKKGIQIDVIADSNDFYDAIWRNDAFLICAATKGIVRLGSQGLEQISDLPSYCIAQAGAAVAAGGLDQFTIYRNGQRDTIKMDRPFLESIDVG